MNRKRFMFWLWDLPEWVPFWLTDAATWAACRIWGHLPERDMCGRPEHDFCTWCRTSMPGTYDRMAARTQDQAGKGDHDA